MALIGSTPNTLPGNAVGSYRVTPVAADVDRILTAYTDDGAVANFVTADLDGQPDVCRNITATAGGTAADIGAIQVTITGTDMRDDVITEDLPAFTVNTAGTVQSTKAFKTVTAVSIPAHDGTGATTSIGVGDKLGLPYKNDRNTVLAAFLNGTKEGTAPTVTSSASVLASNTVDLNSALDGNEVVIDYYNAEG